MEIDHPDESGHMTSAATASPPTGFHIMMPPGWQRYLVNDSGKRALVQKTSERMKALGRPDLDAEARTLIELQWRRLIRTGVSAVYLPGEAEEVIPPASIAARQHVAAGTDFATSVRAQADGACDEFHTPVGAVLRWQVDVEPEQEAGRIRSRRIGYAFPFPEPDTRRGMIFVAAIPYPEDADPQMLEVLTELLDTIMETFRWR